eukprot:s675_g8.t1
MTQIWQNAKTSDGFVKYRELNCHVRSPLWYGVWDMVLAGAVECRLESASDLATLLNALTLRDKEQKDQRVICEASENGLKFTAQSAGKDVTVLGWIFKDAFTEYTFDGAGEEHLHFKLPVAPLLSCLNIFSERAVLAMSSVAQARRACLFHGPQARVQGHLG